MPSEDLPQQIQIARCCASCQHYGPHSSSRGVCGLAQNETVLCIWSCGQWTQRDRLPWPLAKLKPPVPGTLPYRAWKTAYLRDRREHKRAAVAALLKNILSALGLPEAECTPIPAGKKTKDLPASWRRLVAGKTTTNKEGEWGFFELRRLREEKIKISLHQYRSEISRAMQEWKAAYLLDHPPPPKVIQDHSREHNPLDRFSDLA